MWASAWSHPWVTEVRRYVLLCLGVALVAMFGISAILLSLKFTTWMAELLKLGPP